MAIGSTKLSPPTTVTTAIEPSTIFNVLPRPSGTFTLTLPRLGAVLLMLCSSCGGTRPDPTPVVTPISNHRVTAFRGVRVFTGAKVIESANVIISGGTILSVGVESTIPDGAEVIDGAGKTLLPGLIDAHTHTWGPHHLRQALAFGITTELDMMSSPKGSSQLRSSEDPNLASLFFAGNPVTVPGGHGTEYGFTIPTIKAGDDVAEFVRARIREGSDYIKLVYDSQSGRIPTLTPKMLEEAITAAREMDKLAVVHIHRPSEAQAAIEAGAHGLAHVFIGGANEDLSRLIQKRAAFVVPTLSVMYSVCGAKRGQRLAQNEDLSVYLSADAIDNLEKSFPTFGKETPCAQFAEAVRNLSEHGVTILAGTDAPNAGTAHGVSLHDELALLVAAGLSPKKALAAATSATADSFKLVDRGYIAPRKRADLLLVKGDPTQNISHTLNIVGVWKLGVRMDRQKYLTAVSRTPTKETSPPENGLISNFEAEPVSATFGAGWGISTDAMRGGTSQATMAIAKPGAQGSKGALSVSGKVIKAQSPFAWAGVNFSPGADPNSPADLSSRSGVRFVARGDGKTYSIMLFTKSGGFTPSVLKFKTKKNWAPHEFKFADFNGSDGSDLIGIFWGYGPTPGTFKFEIDQVELW